MANKTISLSDEAEVSLEKKRKEDINFNLSAFVSMCLAKDFGRNGRTVEELNNEINKKKAQIQLLEAEIDGLLGQIKFIIDNNEKLKKEQEENIKYEQEKKDIEQFLANMTDADREEYKQGVKIGDFKGAVDYAKFKLGLER